jgi:hypothetical protein
MRSATPPDGQSRAKKLYAKWVWVTGAVLARSSV